MNTRKITHLDTGITTVIKNGKVHVYTKKEHEQIQEKSTKEFRQVIKAFNIVVIFVSVLLIVLGYSDNQLN